MATAQTTEGTYIRIQLHGMETFAEITHDDVTISVTRFPSKDVLKVCDMLVVLSKAIKADVDMREEDIIEVARVR